MWIPEFGDITPIFLGARLISIMWILWENLRKTLIPSYLGKIEHISPTCSRYPAKIATSRVFPYKKNTFRGVGVHHMFGLFIDPLSHVVWLHVDGPEAKGSAHFL